jgi:hypothetical protein
MAVRSRREWSVPYLIVRRSKSSAHVLVIQHHHLEGKVFPQLYKAKEKGFCSVRTGNDGCRPPLYLRF